MRRVVFMRLFICFTAAFLCLLSAPALASAEEAAQAQAQAAHELMQNIPVDEDSWSAPAEDEAAAAPPMEEAPSFQQEQNPNEAMLGQGQRLSRQPAARGP